MAGSVGGGVAVVSNLLKPAYPVLVECSPDEDCVMVVVPKDDQCPILLEGGGDRPGEMSGLSSDLAEVARILYALQDGGSINGFKAISDGTGCKVGISLSKEQAKAWREVLTDQAADDGSIGEASAVLTPTNPTGFPVQWGGASSVESRTEAFDLTAVDGGTL